MYSDKIKQKQKTRQSIKSDFTADGKVISLLNFLEKYLPEFSENISIQRNTDERIINQKLLRFFVSQSILFYFIPENLDESGQNKSKPDISVYEKDLDENGLGVYDDNKKRFFDIECKRLYNPNTREYVYGKTGGIQRFKENKHGVDLPYSAMIGYVETNDFNFWHEKVNSWILDKNEHLTIIENQKIAKFESEHPRISSQNNSITLKHFWVQMSFTI